MIPGEYLLERGDVVANAGRRTVELSVENTGDRPIQVGSHFHFFEVNRALDFARVQAMGMHLNVPAGTGVRFEPGDEKEVELVEFGGMKRVIGFNGLVNGSVQAKWTIKEALERARDLEFAGMDDNLEQETAAVTSRLAKEDQGKKVVQRQGKEQHQGQGKEQQS